MLNFVFIKTLLFSFFTLVLFSSGIFAKDPSFSELVRIIEDKKANSLAELLSHLPESYLKSYALAYNSDSLQEASFDNPRAIVYGDSAKLIISFNGNQSQKGYKNLEVIEYNENKRKFEFHEIEFPDKASRPIVKRNEQKCLSCHGADPRPLWDAYNQWPGMFGANDDRLYSNISSYTKSLKNNDYSTEHKKYLSFFKNKVAHDRYKYLKGNSRLEEATDENDTRAPRVFGSPNQSFNVLLSKHNGQRVSRIIKETYPDALKFKNLTSGIFLNCEKKIESYFPENVVINKKLSNAFREYAEKVFAPKLISEFFSKPKRFLRKLHKDDQYIIDTSDDNRITKAITKNINDQLDHMIIDILTKGNLNSLSMNIGKNETSMNNGLSGIERWIKNFTTDWFEKESKAYKLNLQKFSDPEITELWKFAGLFSKDSLIETKKDEACKEWVGNAKIEIKNNYELLVSLIYKTIENNTNKKEGNIFKSNNAFSCMLCHDGYYGDAPEIPFNNPVKLKNYISLNQSFSSIVEERLYLPHSDKQKMPPNKVLTPSEKEILINYIQSLEVKE